MYKTVQFEIHPQDLTETAQHYLYRAFKTGPDKENWEIFPLIVIDREIEVKEEKN